MNKVKHINISGICKVEIQGRFVNTKMQVDKNVDLHFTYPCIINILNTSGEVVVVDTSELGDLVVTDIGDVDTKCQVK